VEGMLFWVDVGGASGATLASSQALSCYVRGKNQLRFHESGRSGRPHSVYRF